MRRNLIYFGQRFVVALLLALGLSSSGCSDSVSVSEDVAVPLASLAVTPGTLQPGFFSNTTSYKVNAPTSEDSVTVTATPRDSTVEVTINGLVTAAGQGRSISLGTPGSITTITIVLFSQTTGSETTYTINVTRLLSSDDNLLALSVAEGLLSPSSFTANVLDYTVDVTDPNALHVTVSATKSDKNALLLIGGISVPPGQVSGQATIPINGPGTITLVTIEVTAPNGSKKTYRITVNHLSGDNNLSGLTVAPGDLLPAFASNILAYNVDVAATVMEVTITATKSDPNAVLSGAIDDPGAGQASGQKSITLNGAGTATPIAITVTAPNGDFKTYNITVNRAAHSSNNNLSGLVVTPGTLDPAFKKNTTIYTVAVDSSVANVTMTATLEDTNASMTVDGIPTSSGQDQSIPLFGPGTSKDVDILVTAPNGSQKTYTITINRAALASDNNLSALSVTPGFLTPAFASGTLGYAVDVATDITSVDISATKSDPNAVMSGSVTAGTGVPTGQATIPLNGPGTSTPVSITVTAPDLSSKTYAITVNQAPAVPTP